MNVFERISHSESELNSLDFKNLSLLKCITAVWLAWIGLSRVSRAVLTFFFFLSKYQLGFILTTKIFTLDFFQSEHGSLVQREPGYTILLVCKTIEIFLFLYSVILDKNTVK